ncbi:MAG: class I SAM-dependent methyltransferase [Methanoregula sp.]|jgi:SAM-dependent methyltransferase
METGDIDRIYRDVPLERIPWNCKTPPAALVTLVESGRVRPCTAVDLGCGTGNYARYLAQKGFTVTGIDSSPRAIEIARANAERMSVVCRFVVADLLGDLHEIPGRFDFAFDFEVLHHIFPDPRETYVKNVHSLLHPQALYLSVCFAETDPQFGGTGKYRKTPLGTTLYFSTEEELRALFSRHFTVRELRTIEIAGTYGTHQAVYTLMERT